MTATTSSLSGLLKRLENATTRLEDLAIATASANLMAEDGATANNGLIQPHTGVATMAAVAQVSKAIHSDSTAKASAAASISGPARTREATATTEVTSNADDDGPSAVTMFDHWLDLSVKAYVDCSRSMGGLIAQQSDLVLALWQTQRQFIELSTQCKDPNEPEAMATLLRPLSKAIGDVKEFAEAQRGSKLYNHLAAVGEGAAAAGWIALKSPEKPGEYVKEIIDASTFYLNRIKMQIKQEATGEEVHNAWIVSYVTMLNDLKQYIEGYYSRGLSWKEDGQDALTWSAGEKKDRGLSAVFDALAGSAEGITARLKKVSDEQKTHKNPDLRAGSVVKSREAGPDTKTTTVPNKPPRSELLGKKWIIENYSDTKDLKIETSLGQSVEIYNCKSCTVQVIGKCTAISMLSCPKTALVIQSVVSELSITNCSGFSMQTTGTLPTLLVENTDGGQIYLGRESLEVQVITSKTSALNILLPTDTEGDYTEKALPEQLQTTIVDGKLVTVPVIHT